MKLWLIGDDEVLDAVADLSRHLDYFEVARTDEPPDRALGQNDHLLIAMGDRRAAQSLLTDQGASAAFAKIIEPLKRGSDGARAILAAADLVSALERD